MPDRSGFILDLNRCTGCRACELACSTENGLALGQSWRRIETFNINRDPRASLHHLSIGCNHCANAPCAAACPARAITWDDRSGLVVLDIDRCLGCGYCAWVCPFEAPTYDEFAGVMGKCTFCSERTAQGDKPACVEACPTDALTVGDMGTAGLTDAVPGFPETAADPAMRFKPLRAGARPLETTWTLDPAVLQAFDAVRPPTVLAGGMRDEWPLLVFTLTASVLVALQTAFVFNEIVPPLVLALVAAGAAGISMLHLGRPGRAWRAATGFGSSWLSREIVLYGAFVGLLALQAVAPEIVKVRWAAAVVGWLMLVAVDRVYDPVRRPREMSAHSADVLGVAAFLTAIVLGQLPVALVVAGIRSLLFALRQDLFGRRRVTAWAQAVIRFGPPAIGLLMLANGGSLMATLSLVGIGEVADRLMFYLDLRPTTIAETIDADLISVVSG